MHYQLNVDNVGIIKNLKEIKLKNDFTAREGFSFTPEYIFRHSTC